MVRAVVRGDTPSLCLCTLSLPLIKRRTKEGSTERTESVIERPERISIATCRMVQLTRKHLPQYIKYTEDDDICNDNICRNADAFGVVDVSVAAYLVVLCKFDF